MKTPRVSVIVCTYNRAHSLPESLATILKQRGVSPDEWELLVVDNNSRDHTRQVVEEIMAANGCRVRYLFEGRQGKSYALNRAIENARGEVLAFTDDDVFVDKHWLASILEATSTYPHKGFGGRLLPLWPDRVPSWLAKEGPYSKPAVGGPIPSHDRGEEVKEYDRGMWAPVGGNMFFRREVFERYGGFRLGVCPTGDNFFWTTEDCELGFRLMKHGEKILYYPRAVVYHPVPAHKLSQSYLLRYSWDAGLRGGRMELEDERPSLLRRLRGTVKSASLLVPNLLKLFFRAGNEAARFHYKCNLLYFSGRSLSYLTLRPKLPSANRS